MGDLIDLLFPDATVQEKLELSALSAERQKHFGQRRCPRGCGCEEFYDDRHPDVVEGGFGVAGCQCPRCNGIEETP